MSTVPDKLFGSDVFYNVTDLCRAPEETPPWKPTFLHSKRDGFVGRIIDTHILSAQIRRLFGGRSSRTSDRHGFYSSVGRYSLFIVIPWIHYVEAYRRGDRSRQGFHRRWASTLPPREADHEESGSEADRRRSFGIFCEFDRPW